ncbi:CCE_0567 family metalloprotein [Tropicimonas sp. IMCC34043]|uniref:CCE_0567 family metalloprotein n=1 Tax=Tropicimonas sp. IMCC34043 TaxID=2248760 RepID=UPI0018E578D7|nr:CCE_0567 family metalloprotein [Tropicimonas sp. IMCC34043]
MSVEELEARIKKLSMRSTTAKMNLHDLSEELPTDWQKIPEVAEATYEVFKELAEARKALKEAKKAEA